MNRWEEMRAAINEANAVIRAADNVSGQMAEMMVGRLRKVDNGYTLAKLKKELEQFNAHTRRWKS